MKLKTEQQLFNQIKGTITEINNCDQWCSIVVSVGHENKRLVNFVCKKTLFDSLFSKVNFKISEFVVCRFFISSRKAENERYYTNANLLDIWRG